MTAQSTRRSTRLDVRVLGRLEIQARGRTVRLASRNAQALFALLVLARRPRSRDAIAADLWPEVAGSGAVLRQALWLVRTALVGAGLNPDAVLETDGDLLGLRPDASIMLDATAFESCARDETCGPEEAVALYRGDLLEALGHECFAGERERLSDLYEDALARVAAVRLAGGELDRARAAAEDLLARDPLREEAYATLIAVHGLGGTRSQVVRQYRRLVTILDRELDVQPLPETEVVYRTALADSVERSRERVAAALPPPTAIETIRRRESGAAG